MYLIIIHSQGKVTQMPQKGGTQGGRTFAWYLQTN